MFNQKEIQQTYYTLMHRAESTGALPLAYVAHWIMFNLWEDLFNQRFPRGTGEHLTKVRGNMEVQVANASGKANSALCSPEVLVL